ncbi:MAG: c-type cytochrome [Paracoccaceae bacterium]
MKKRVLAAVGGVAALAVVSGIAFANRHPVLPPIAPPDASAFDPASIERGELLAGLGNCAVCHTTPGGAPLTGGLALPTPFGTIQTTNITPDPDTGIGTWSQKAFVRAMRFGVDREGRHLYPAFPYDFYTRITDPDLADLYAFLMTQPAVVAEPQANSLAFPFNQRMLLAGWNLLFLDPGPQPDLADKDEEWNRGRYLTEGLGHCAACHSPRNALGAAARTGPDAYGGGEAEGWHVPPLNATNPAPAPWSVDALANYLIDGWDRDHGIAAGPMRPVADDLYDQPEEDAVAIAVYVLDLLQQDIPSDSLRAQLDTARATAQARDWNAPGAPALPTDPLLARGAGVFEAHCAECHRTGTKSAPLALSATLNAPDARNFVEVVLRGINPAPLGASDRSMPARAIQINDEDLTALAAFARDRFGREGVWGDIAGTVAEARDRSSLDH